MKIDKQPLEDHQVKLTVEVEPEKMEQAKKTAARQIARQVKVPGFRPGKAPYQVIVRQVGEEAIIEEALEVLVKDIYPKVLDEAEIQPYGPGQLENVVSTDPPVLEFVVPLQAEVILGDYRSMEKAYEPPAVTDDQVEQVLKDLQSRQAVLEPADRPVQEGDMAYVRISAERVNPEEGQDPILVRERSIPFIVRGEDTPEDEPEEWPFPGFSRQLIGLTKNDEKVIEHRFSEETDFQSLRGVEARFKIVVEDVKSRILPELNDEFAASVGEFETMDELRKEIRSSLEQQVTDSYDESYDEELIEEAVEQSVIKYPPQMLEREIDSVIHNLEHRLEEQNMDLDLYLKTRQIDMEDLKEEVRPVAESRLKRSLFLYELAEAEQIQVGQEDLQMETLRTLETLSQTLPEKEARRLGNRDVIGSLMSSVMADLVTRRSMERLRKIASGQLEEEAKAAQAQAEAAPEAEPEVSETEAEPAEETPAGESAEAGAEPAAESTGSSVSDQEEKSPVED